MAFEVVPPRSLRLFYHSLSGLRMQVFVPKVVFEIVLEMVQIRFLIFESVIGNVPQFRCGIAEVSYDNLLAFGKLSRYIQNQHTCALHSDSIIPTSLSLYPNPLKRMDFSDGCFIMVYNKSDVRKTKG